jgi:hypothetical protein
MSNFNDEICEYSYSTSVTENFGTENFGTANFGTENFGTENFGTRLSLQQKCIQKCTFAHNCTTAHGQQAYFDLPNCKTNCDNKDK